MYIIMTRPWLQLGRPELAAHPVSSLVSVLDTGSIHLNSLVDCCTRVGFERETKDRGSLLKTLILDRRSHVRRERNIEERWLKDGLVMEGMEFPMEWGRRCIYSDESDSDSITAVEWGGRSSCVTVSIFV